MQRVDKVMCTIMSTPIVEMESPFYLSFTVNVAGDNILATFIGNFARALKNNIRVGDKVVIRDGLIDRGKLVFDFMHLEPHTAVGRSINTYV